MVINDPCGVCNRSVHRNHRFVHCNICQCKVHIGCNFISPSTYAEFKTQRDNTEIPANEKESFYCSTCINNEIPFGNQNHNIFHSTNSLGFNHDSNIENLEITLDKKTKSQIKEIKRLIFENTDPDNESTFSCGYYSVDKFVKSKFKNKNNLSIFHLNIASLQYHMDDLKNLLSTLEYEFDIISISETKLKQNLPPTIDINIPNYHYEHTPSVANKGGTLIYI